MDLVGYIYVGAVYCEDCLPVSHTEPEVGGIWDYQEFDSPLHCDGCQALLPASLTREGWEDLKGRYLDGWRDAEMLDLYWRAFNWLDWYFIPTFVGLIDPDGNLKD